MQAGNLRLCSRTLLHQAEVPKARSCPPDDHCITFAAGQDCSTALHSRDPPLAYEPLHSSLSHVDCAWKTGRTPLITAGVDVAGCTSRSMRPSRRQRKDDSLPEAALAGDLWMYAGFIDGGQFDHIRAPSLTSLVRQMQNGQHSDCGPRSTRSLETWNCHG